MAYYYHGGGRICPGVSDLTRLDDTKTTLPTSVQDRGDRGHSYSGRCMAGDVLAGNMLAAAVTTRIASCNLQGGQEPLLIPPLVAYVTSEGAWYREPAATDLHASGRESQQAHIRTDRSFLQLNSRRPP